MAEELNQNDDLINKIRKIIEKNRKFLARVMEDEFELETEVEAAIKIEICHEESEPRY